MTVTIYDSGAIVFDKQNNRLLLGSNLEYLWIGQSAKIPELVFLKDNGKIRHPQSVEDVMKSRVVFFLDSRVWVFNFVEQTYGYYLR